MASDEDQVFEVSPFLGAIVDHLCGTSKLAVTTPVFTYYVDHFNKL